MNIIYENKDLVIIDKPAGLLVHPVSTHPRGEISRHLAGDEITLVHQILNKWPQIKKYKWADENRSGIVHRLDQDTSGLIVIAKNPQTLKSLQNQFKEHKVKKIYWALVLGKVEPKKGEIITQILRDKKNKSVKQKISSFNLSWQKSKQAITKYRVIRYYKYIPKHLRGIHTSEVKSANTSEVVEVALSLLELEIKTGRTHQIRAQLKHKGWPIIGDELYNTKESIKLSKELDLHRQFLHAKKLELMLPNIEQKKYESPLAEELSQVLEKLEIL